MHEIITIYFVSRVSLESLATHWHRMSAASTCSCKSQSLTRITFPGRFELTTNNGQFTGNQQLIMAHLYIMQLLLC